MSGPGEKHSVAFDHPLTADKLSRDVERGLSRPLRPLTTTDDLPAISAYSSFTVVDDGASVLDESSSSFRGRITRYFTEEVDTRRSDVLLIACSFISGMIDSAAFNAWGSFASMQTGTSSIPSQLDPYYQDVWKID